MRWFSNSSTWDDPIDVTRFYNRINGNYDLLIHDKTVNHLLFYQNNYLKETN